MTETAVRVDVGDDGVSGEVSIVVAPGTKAAVRDRLLEGAIGALLTDAAEKLDAVLVAAPSAYAFVQPGKDESGHTRFVVSGALEGDRLVPRRPDVKARSKDRGGSRR